LGAVGGAQNVTLAANQIPTIASSGSNSISVSSSASVLSNGGSIITLGNGGSPSGVSWVGIPTVGALASSGSNSISVTYTNASQVAAKTVQPTIVCNYIIRII
jgi:hypothetical protein